jgi:Raf kinase inhibitor-like YbhB/YbcL family protein
MHVPFEASSSTRSGRLLALAALLAMACSSGAGGPVGGAGGEPSGGEGGGGAGMGGGAGAGGGGQSGSGGKPMADAAAPGADAAGGSGGGAAEAGIDSAASDAPASEPDAPVASGPLTLTSSVFKEGESIATMYRCKFANVSPPLSWTPGPTGTKSYAIVMVHTTSLHWVLWDIPVSTLSLPMGVERLPEPPVPAGSKQAKPNLDGATWYGYTGPCPATSSHYEYIIYALDVVTLPGVTPESTSKQANTAILAHKLASAQLSGTAAN